MRNWIKTVTSVFFLGYIPLIPGTVTSAIFAFLIYKFVNNFALFCFLGVAINLLGFSLSGRAIDIYNRSDPRQVVIDELAGLFFALFLIPHQPWIFIVNLLIYRLFDILKPPPLSTVERIRGSAGIMLDDLLAGLFANIFTQILLRWVL